MSNETFSAISITYFLDSCTIFKIFANNSTDSNILTLYLDLSNNWQTSHWEYHANEKEEGALLAMFIHP